jgi:hypothetical protein
MPAIFPIDKMQLRSIDLAGNFALRQGLWTEDLQTPPGQECSNGSSILFAVVLWRTLLLGATAGRAVPSDYEAPQS